MEGIKREKRKWVVLLLMAVCFVYVWPYGGIRDEKISRTAADYSMNTGGIGEIAAIQEFIPAYDEIKSVGIDIGKLEGKANQGTLSMDFFDAQLNQIAHFTQNVADMNDGTLTDVEVNLSLKAGERYFLSIQCTEYGETPPILHYRSFAGNGPEENLNFYYGPAVIADASANIRYTYYIPLNIGQILFYDSLILLAGVAAMYVLDIKKGNQKEDEQD